MSFFKLPHWLRLNNNDDQRSEPVPSLETLKQRARNRLIGATVLVVLGLVSFPFLFKNPRPSNLSEVSITIPDRPDVKVVVGEISTSPTPATPVSEPAPVPQAPQPAPEVVKEAGVKGDMDITAKAPMVPVPSPAVDKRKSLAPADEPAKTDASKAKPAGQRFVVQVGAFAEEKKVKEVRSKLEKAGIKTYTQVIGKGPDKRTRVRVGPFDSREAALKVQERIERLNLPVTTLAL